MRYLFLSPHQDDVELTCGATIAGLKGHDVHIAVFSDCGLDRAEIINAHHALGVTGHYYDFERRIFPEWRQEILDEIIKLRDKIRPDVVFIPDMSDIHQDHQVIALEGLRAFKLGADVISYAHPHNQIGGNCNYFVSILEEELQKKIKVLSYYRSQAGRFYFDPEAVRAVARFYGVQCGRKYAEAFKIIRKYEGKYYHPDG